MATYFELIIKFISMIMIKNIHNIINYHVPKIITLMLIVLKYDNYYVRYNMY